MGELYFDCLRCHAITLIRERRRCASCGSGVGAVARSPEGAFRRPTAQPEQSKLPRSGHEAGPQR